MGGKSNFCGTKKHFPECDPQLPPSIEFYAGEGKTNIGQDYSIFRISDAPMINKAEH